VPTWASSMVLQLHIDAMNLHLTVLTLNLNLNPLIPLNQNFHLKKIHMCMLIISDRWKSEGVCMCMLRYMRDTFLKLDTMLNDELVRGKINNQYPFTSSAYPTKIHLVLCGSSAFLFSKGILAHAREPKI
jgi:hypothetical protein